MEKGGRACNALTLRGEQEYSFLQTALSGTENTSK